jgi:TonB-like protein
MSTISLVHKLRNTCVGTSLPVYFVGAKTIKLSILAVPVLFLLAGLPQEEKQPIVYVKHLEPPLHYPPLARTAQLHGAVIVKLKIAADGAVIATESSPGDAQTVGYLFLRDETEKLVKKWTFGCANCSSDTPYEKTIKFTYRLEGEGILYDNTRVSMDLPDEVTITASPVQCDHCPPKKKGKN